MTEVKIENMDISKYEMYLSKALFEGTKGLEGKAKMDKVVSNIVHNLQVFGNQLHRLVHFKGLMSSEKVINKIEKKFDQFNADVSELKPQLHKLPRLHKEALLDHAALLDHVVTETKQIIQALKKAGVSEDKMKGWEEKIELFGEQIKTINSKSTHESLESADVSLEGRKNLEKASDEKIKKGEAKKDKNVTLALQSNVIRGFFELVESLREARLASFKIPDFVDILGNVLNDPLEVRLNRFVLLHPGEIKHSDLNDLADLFEEHFKSRNEPIPADVKTKFEQIHTQLQIIEQGKKQRKGV